MPHSYIFSITVSIATIFNINPQLVLPEQFPLGQKCHRFKFNFFYDSYRHALVATATSTPIVMAKTTNLLLTSCLWFECQGLNGVLLLPTYCPPHFLHEHKYITQAESQSTFCLILYFLPVLKLVKSFLSSKIGQDTLHFLLHL